MFLEGLGSLVLGEGHGGRGGDAALGARVEVVSAAAGEVGRRRLGFCV
jgi:hypothetical protein